MRPQKWEDSQVGFRGSNASGRRIVLLPGAFWAHGASKMAILGASFLLCILQCFSVWEGMLPPGACRMSHASARRIVSCSGLCVSSLCSQIPLAPAPTFGAFRKRHIRKNHINFLKPSWMAGCPWEHPAGVPGKNALFCPLFSIVNNRKSPGHRPVDPCLSRWVSPGTPGRCPVNFLKFMCPFLS